MRTSTALIAGAGLVIALTTYASSARADGWSVAIGVGTPSIVVAPSYGQPPGYYVPTYPLGYAPPPDYGYRRGYYPDEYSPSYRPPVGIRGEDEDDDDD